MNKLTTSDLIHEAKLFCEANSQINHSELLGVTDGKAVGTYVEHLFIKQLEKKYVFNKGNSAHGVDIPDEDIMVDVKTTSSKQPQSSCPFKSAEQKIYGLGYNVILFVYNKEDGKDWCKLNFKYCTYISADRTADYTITKRLIEMIEDGANKQDVISFLIDRNIPLDEIGMEELADRILSTPPKQGYLTISNALQWRLQYARVMALNNTVQGVINYEW